MSDSEVGGVAMLDDHNAWVILSKKKVKKKSTKSHVKVIDYSLTEMQAFLTTKVRI